MNDLLLSIRHIDVSYSGRPILHDVSMDLRRGEIVGVVGESGSGKSTTIYSVLGILGRNGSVDAGEILYDGRDLMKLHKQELRSLCGRELSLIAQNPTDSFHPTRKIRREIRELAAAHSGVSAEEAEESMIRIMEKMKLNGEDVLRKYAFELSGGMCQRASIAMAMALHPQVLFADEPTSALDVVVQKQVVEELQGIRDAYGTAILIVSHNMGVISYISDYIYVMLAGVVVESGTREQVVQDPKHPYTQNLIRVIPRINCPAPRGVRATEHVRVESACPYYRICPLAAEKCSRERPGIRQLDDGRWIRCHRM